MPNHLLFDRTRVAVLATTLLVVLAAGCAPFDKRPSGEVHAELMHRIPATVPDRDGWARDIQAALHHLDIEPYTENLCAVLAVIEQESTYRADPPVPGLPRIARKEIARRAARLHVPGALVDAALRVRSPDGRTYAKRLDSLRTEQELSALFEEMTQRIPMGRRLLRGFNPVQTAGPMQVSIRFSELHAKGYPYPLDGSIRHEVFSRRGGLYFGIQHLLGYPTHYTRKVHRFADFNAGWYASRNAAFQGAVAKATGQALALDGDLLVPGAALDAPGATERAVRSLGMDLQMDDAGIRRELETSGRLSFDDTGLYQRVFSLAEHKVGHALPRAVLPDIALHSPKISRKLSTAWFAKRVDQRYRQCLAR